EATASLGGDPFADRTTAEALERIADGRDEHDDLGWVGGQLWGGLFSGLVAAAFERVRAAGDADGRPLHLRLAPPQAPRGPPWEALYDPDGGFLANREQYCVIRSGARKAAPAPGWAARGRTPGVLMVLPGGSDLDLERERRVVDNLVKATGGAVRLEVL